MILFGGQGRGPGRLLALVVFEACCGGENGVKPQDESNRNRCNERGVDTETASNVWKVDNGARIGNYGGGGGRVRNRQTSANKTARVSRKTGRRGETRLGRGGGEVENAARLGEFGVEQGGAGGTGDQNCGEQGEFDVEQGAFADAADDGGHAVACVEIAADWGRFSSSRTMTGFLTAVRRSFFEGGQAGVDLGSCAKLRGTSRGRRFFQAEGDTFRVARRRRGRIAVGTDAAAGRQETRAIPFAAELLRSTSIFSSSPLMKGDDVALDIPSRGRRDSRRRRWLRVRPRFPKPKAKSGERSKPRTRPAVRGCFR